LHDFVDAILGLLLGGAAAANNNRGASTQHLLALAAKAHAEAGMVNHRMVAMPGLSPACAALLALVGGVPGALLAALRPEDMAAWLDRITAMGLGGEAMNCIFAEGLADIAPTGVVRSGSKDGSGDNAPAIAKFSPRVVLCLHRQRWQRRRIGVRRRGAPAQPVVINCNIVTNTGDARMLL
jgi:hypothetical protein